MFGHRNKQNDVSCQPPRRPARQQSFPGKAAPPASAPVSLDATKRNGNGNGNINGSYKYSYSERRNDDSINGHENKDGLSISQCRSTNTTPCSTIYCCSNCEDDISSDNTTLLTEDRIRAFLHDYYADYDALRGKQSIDTWSCFAEEYFGSRYQFVRPSGNPIDAAALVKSLSSDVRIRSIQMVSVDAITILSSSNAAIVIYTCDHAFEYKGILNEDRAVMTCVLEMVRGEIKIMHEHRTSGRPIPRETRWQSES